jgi:hypothetical protein
MFEVLRVQAVAFKEEKPQATRIERKETAAAKIKIGSLPKEVKAFLDFVPLGFQLEAYVKKATRDEVILRLNFLGRQVEISVKNLLGLELQPNQRVVLTLIERNPYVLKLSTPFTEGFKIFSYVRQFFKTPIPRILNMFFNIPDTFFGVKNSGLFYERKIVEYLLGKENLSTIKSDIKYHLLNIVKGWKFDKPQMEIVIRPLGIVRNFYKLPLYRVDLTKFLKVYGSFYQLSPSAIAKFSEFIFLTRKKLKSKKIHLRKIKKKELDKPAFFAKPNRHFYKTLGDKLISFNLLKETVEFLQFLQGWSVINNFEKAIIPFPYKGRKFFIGFYRTGVNRNISLLWENGLVKLTYRDTNPWQGEILFVVNDEGILRNLNKNIDELKKELEKIHFTPTEIKFAAAPNVEELFILDMADKEHSNFMKLYL